MSYTTVPTTTEVSASGDVTTHWVCSTPQGTHTYTTTTISHAYPYRNLCCEHCWRPITPEERAPRRPGDFHKVAFCSRHCATNLKGWLYTQGELGGYALLERTGSPEAALRERRALLHKPLQ